MKKQTIIPAALGLLLLSPVAWSCDYPDRVNIPDGSTATKEDMLEGQTSVKDYMAQMEEYLACIEEEEQATVASMPEISEEDLATRNATLTKKYNAAVEEMELLAAQFNEQVRAYKAQSE